MIYEQFSLIHVAYVCNGFDNLQLHFLWMPHYLNMLLKAV